jgi:hypothetical protein
LAKFAEEFIMFAFHNQPAPNPYSLRATLVGAASNLLMVGVVASMLAASPQVSAQTIEYAAEQIDSDVYHRSMVIDGIDIAYREAGDPSRHTILLLHGFPTSSQMFRDLIPELAKSYHVLAPDYPG